jgi:translocator protein
MKIPSLHSLFLLTGCIILPLLVGGIGSIATYSSIPTWYASLTKPWFNPPNWVFGPVWTVLYILMGISLWLIIRNGFEDQAVRNGMLFFAAQLIINLFWSLVFFGMRSPIGGLLTILVLIILIVLTIRAFRPVSTPAAYLMIPYLCWTCIATVLNVAIVLLN